MVSALAVLPISSLSYIEEDGWRDMNADHSVCLSSVKESVGRV
jgi:hypothetical protein